MDFNPYLKRRLDSRPGASPGKGTIEHPADAQNIVWQTRASPPSPYENQFGDALERVFEAGATELPEVVAKLNEMGFHAPDGRVWTEASFQEEMRRLAGA